MAIHIYRPHRDALCLEAAHGFRLVTQALRSGDMEFFRGLRPAVEAVARVLDDLGWGLHTHGRQFELTLPAEQLAVAIDFLDGRARPFAEARMAAPDAAVRSNDPILEHLTELLITTERVMRQTGPAPSQPQSLREQTEPVTQLRELDRAQRDLLHHAAWFVFRGDPSIGDLILAGRVHEARAMRYGHEAMWRLVDDLGWRFQDPRQTFSLTLTDTQAAAALASIQTSAHGAGERTDHVRDNATAGREHNKAVVKLCRELLAQLPGEIVAHVSQSGRRS